VTWTVAAGAGRDMGTTRYAHAHRAAWYPYNMVSFPATYWDINSYLCRAHILLERAIGCLGTCAGASILLSVVTSRTYLCILKPWMDRAMGCYWLSRTFLQAARATQAGRTFSGTQTPPSAPPPVARYHN